VYCCYFLGDQVPVYATFPFFQESRKTHFFTAFNTLALAIGREFVPATSSTRELVLLAVVAGEKKF
jgi:hypothetical protein